jgi:hypothetical protein
MLFTEPAESALAIELDSGVRYTEPVEGSQPIDTVVVPLET